MADTDSQESPDPTPEVVEAWSSYAKDRYSLEESHRSEFRGWARQLVAAFPPVISLQIVVAGYVWNSRQSLDKGLVAFFLTVVILGGLAVLPFWGLAIRRGFEGTERLGPESPVELAKHLAHKSKTDIVGIIGAYYAKAADALHEHNEKLAKDIRRIARVFAGSLFAFFVASIVLVTYGLPTPPKKDKGIPMSDNQSSQDKPASPATPPPVTPPPSPAPILNTPTPGQHETSGYKPPKIR